MKFPWSLTLACCLATNVIRADDGRGSDLAFAIIVSRHGICAPGSNMEFERYGRDPWPQWKDPVGQLTQRGERQMVLLGEYYRARYVEAGLLTGDPKQDASRIFFRANSEQRTLESARRLGAGLLPNAPVKVHALPQGTTDPLFRPNLVPIGVPRKALADAAVLGRIGNDPEAVVHAHGAAFQALQRVMAGGDGTLPAGKELLTSAKAAIGPSLGSHIVSLNGSLRLGMVFADTFMMQYAEGLALSEVGWGRVTRDSLTQLLELHSLYYELTQRTLYPAQVQGSNLASHLLETLEQAETGRPVPGAIGDPGHRLVVVVGHDTNLLNLSGLLNVTWLFPDTQLNLVAPGGAMILELWRRRSDGRPVVRVLYVGPSLDQMRELQALSLANPPPIVPLFVPGCSGSEPGYATPLLEFVTHLRQVMAPEFVQP